MLWGRQSCLQPPFRRLFRVIRKSFTADRPRPKIEERLREWAQAEGLSATAYIERLVYADQSAEEELEEVALEGLTPATPSKLGLVTGKRSTAAWMNA